MAAGESMLADFQLIAVIIARGGGLGQVDGFLTLVAGAFCAASGIQPCKLLEGGVRVAMNSSNPQAVKSPEQKALGSGSPQALHYTPLKSL